MFDRCLCNIHRTVLIAHGKDFYALLAKAIEKDKTFGIGDNGEIKNISFGLYAAEDIVSASGTVIPADGLIEIVSVNENGTAVMLSLIHISIWR